MSDKALNPATLELTQKIQLHFPREIQANSLRAWNGASAELLTARLLEMFGNPPVVEIPAPRIIEPIFLPSITSDGRTGKQFITDLEKKKFQVGNEAKFCMTKSKDADGKLAFVSSSGVTYKPVIIKGEAFEDNERITSNIRRVAAERKYITPPAELAPLLREAISDEQIAQMGLTWLIVMHEPITDSDGYPYLLGVGRRGGGRGLRAYWDDPDDRWRRVSGFVFLAPQE